MPKPVVEPRRGPRRSEDCGLAMVISPSERRFRMLRWLSAVPGRLGPSAAVSGGGIMCGATRSCAWKDMDAASLGERRVDRLPSHSGGANVCGAHGAREEAADIFSLV